ncbi:MAG: hypothetical protein HN509_01275 [Halobacteriovoraceae bacterium]|jgi:hypothetical protein|nr:hypothetical protein [Halobacteriovoraceae bacterium]MBT5093358.1 hypothetical protein [Halobacteriovoraceae bacterium]
MIESETIMAVYGQVNFTTQESRKVVSSYALLYVFDANGNIDRDVLENLYCDVYGDSSYLGHPLYIGPFEDLEILNQYAFKLCSQLNAADITMVSVSEYNAIIERESKPSQLLLGLYEEGNTIKNLDRKKGLFSKIFS